VNEPLAQRILDLIYKDSGVHRTYKDTLADWILDTQSRNAPLDTATLVKYLAGHQPDVLERLKINVHIQDDLTRALDSVDRN
jgi:hypothetical protein